MAPPESEQQRAGGSLTTDGYGPNEPNQAAGNTLEAPNRNRFRGVAYSHHADLPAAYAADPGEAEAALEKSILEARDGRLAPTQITLTKMLETGPAGLEHIKLEPLSPSIGTVIHGVDLARLSDAEVAFIRKVWLERKVVFFRNQGHISHEQHVAFTARFGEPGPGTHGELEQEPSKEKTGKLGAERRPTVPGQPMVLQFLATAKAPEAASNWHSEVSWARRPPMATTLIGRKVPPIGGSTLFTDAYAMYEGLRPELKARIQNLRAYHQGHPYGHGTFNVSAEHPVLRTHPETGRTTLYVNGRFTKRILGVSEEESKALLAELCAQVHTPEYQCRFSWEEGSLAMWDNRACQHYASGDFWPHERYMERVTIVMPNAEDKIPFYRPAAAARL